MTRRSILVVDDDMLIRNLLSIGLSKTFDVRTANDGAQALTLAEEEAPDLIISDIMMPNLDGFGLFSAIQKRNRSHAIKFIFLTAKGDDQTRARGVATGADDYITKPFSLRDLVDRVENLLS